MSAATLLLDQWWDRPERDDALTPARGILLAIVLGIVAWLAIGLLVWWLV